MGRERKCKKKIKITNCTAGILSYQNYSTLSESSWTSLNAKSMVSEGVMQNIAKYVIYLKNSHLTNGNEETSVKPNTFKDTSVKLIQTIKTNTVLILLLKWFVHLFIFTKGFLLVSVTVDLESILGTLGARNKPCMGYQAITRHHAQTSTHAFTPRGSLEEPVHLPACLWEVTGNWRTERTQICGEHEKFHTDRIEQ